MIIKKGKYRIIASVLIFIAILVSVGFFMQMRMKQLLYNYMEKQVTFQAEQLSGLIKLRFDMELQNMERMASGLNRADKGNGNFIGQLGGYLFPADSKGMTAGLLALDGTAVHGNALDFSKFTGIQDAFRGNPSISFSKGNGLLFTVPIYKNSNVKYVFYRLYAADALKKEFFVEGFDGMGDMAVVDVNEQEIMPFTEHDFKDLYENAKDHTAYLELQDRLNVATTASIYYKNNIASQFMFVTEVSGYGIYLVGIVADEVASEGLSSLITLIIWVFALLILLMVIGIAYLFNAEERAKESDELRMEKLVAENASKSKSDFLANMSHEIRTPINAIMGMNEMVLRECTDANIKKYAANIQGASRALLSLINDILDLSKIESGKMEIVPEIYQMDTLIRDVVNMIQIKADQKKLAFHVNVEESLPNKLHGDEVRIRQVMVNLLNNAVKYTREGSVSLKISAENMTSEQAALKISVSDTGIGIKQEDMGKLFGNFERLDIEKNHDIEGTGLGLAITKKLIEAMDGRIEVASTYGQGTVFTVYLPQKIIDHTPIGNFEKSIDKNISDQEIHKEHFIAPDARILVVDDNDMNLLVVESLLKRTKIQVVSCNSGEQCLEHMQKEHFHVILLDHMMPGMDGIEVMKRSKTLARNLCKDVPIIALTANAIKGVREMYISEGFDDYLSKPIESDKLEEMLKKYLPAQLLQEPVEDRVQINSNPSIHTAITDADRLDDNNVAADCKLEIHTTVTGDNGLGDKHIAADDKPDIHTIVTDKYRIGNNNFVANDMSGIFTAVAKDDSLDNNNVSEDGKPDIHTEVTENGKLADNNVVTNDMSAFHTAVTEDNELADNNVVTNDMSGIFTSVKNVNSFDDNSIATDGMSAFRTAVRGNNSTIDTESQITESELINHRTALKYCAGSETLYLRILKIFCSLEASKKEKLKLYMEQQAWDDYRIEIHSLKSTSLNIGCQRLYDTALLLEKACKAGDTSYVIQNHDKCMLLYSNVVAEGQHYLEAQGATGEIG